MLDIFMFIAHLTRFLEMKAYGTALGRLKYTLFSNAGNIKIFGFFPGKIF